MDQEHDDDRNHHHIDVVATVLGHDDPQHRSSVVAHLLACPECRAEYDELSAAVNDVLPAIPAVQPPLGFDQAVLARMGIMPNVRVHRRAAWQWFAAAAVALVVGAGALAFAAIRDDDTPSNASATTTATTTTTTTTRTTTTGEVRPLSKTTDGAHVGTVSLSDVDGEPVMVVAIVAAPDGASYSCLTTFADGTTSLSESWPAGNGAWIVPLADATTADVRTVDLVVAGTDRVWSSASFDS